MPPANQTDYHAVIATKISGPRLAPYLAATDGNVRRALTLYQWSVELSGAVYECLHRFEVILRNALDEQLCRWNAVQRDRQTGRSHSSDWLTDPARLLRRLAGDDIRKASRRAQTALRGAGRAPGHPDVLAQLSFGTWSMVADRLARMRTVLLAIDPVLEMWFVSRQRVTATLKTQP